MNMKKRRFYEGGPTEDEDKATGLAASKGEDVGFFKRLSMGNIDKADSEAGQQFGAGRARLDRMPAAPNRSKSMGNMEGIEGPAMPEAPKRTSMGNMEGLEGPTIPEGPKRTSMGNMQGMPTARPTVRPNISASDKPMRPVGPMGPAKRGEIPGQADDVKAPPSTGEDTSGPSNLDRLVGGVPVGGGLKKMAGLAKGFASGKGAGTAGRALAEAETTPVTFLGKSAPKNITPVERIGSEQAKRLAYTEGKGATSAAAPRIGGPAATAEKAAEAVARLKGPKTGGSSGPQGRNPFSAAKEKSPRGRSSFKTAEDLEPEFKRGGKTKAYAKGGSVSSRGDGIAQRGKTRGMMR
jgi:hypothetical protein